MKFIFIILEPQYVTKHQLQGTLKGFVRNMFEETSYRKKTTAWQDISRQPYVSLATPVTTFSTFPKLAPIFMKSKKYLYVQLIDVVALPTYLPKYVTTSMEQSHS